MVSGLKMTLSELYDTLQERATQAENNDDWISHDEVMRKVRDIIDKECESANV